jgi:hypothetical protein
MGLSAAGVTVSMLGATAITASTGGGDHGALWTGAFLIILFVAKAAAVRVVPSWSDRLGPERLFVLTNFGLMILWGGAGILVVLGAPATVIVLAIAPLAGVANGVFAIETPLLSKAFLSGHSMAAANARVSVVRGVTCALAALGAGLLINFAGAGWALMARALLSIPLVLVIRQAPRSPGRSVSHGATPAAAESGADGDSEGPGIMADPAVRRVILLAVTLTIATAPVIAMIVPIAQSLRQTPLVIGASIMLAAMSAGGLLAPLFVHLFEGRRSRGQDPLSAALIATGLSLVAFGVVSIFLTDRSELVAWAAIGLIFGGAESASHSTVLGQIVRVSGRFDVRHAIATMKFATNLAAPIGFVIWAVLLDTTNGATAILVSATAMILMALTFGRSRPVIAMEEPTSRN